MDEKVHLFSHFIVIRVYQFLIIICGNDVACLRHMTSRLLLPLQQVRHLGNKSTRTQVNSYLSQLVPTFGQLVP